MADDAPAAQAGPIQSFLGALMIVAGLAIAAVFGGGLAVFLWVDFENLMAGRADGTRLMSTLLIGPLVGLAPALLGLVLARNGWRRWYPLPETEDEEEAP